MTDSMQPNRPMRRPLPHVLGEYAESGCARYHMPGHKGRGMGAFLPCEAARWDVTELAMTDNLHEPTGCIQETQRMDIRGCGTNTGYVNERWRALYARMCSDGTPFSEAELAIGGEEIMHAAGIGPGQRVGEIKRELFLHCARHPHDNSKKRLLALTAQMRRGGTGI